MTLRSLERGSAGVTIGSYLAVMQVLGLEQDFNLLAKEDALGRMLQDGRVPGRKRATAKAKPRSKSAQPEVIGDTTPPSATVHEQQKPYTTPLTPTWMREMGFTSSEDLAALLKSVTSK